MEDREDQILYFRCGVSREIRRVSEKLLTRAGSLPGAERAGPGVFEHPSLTQLLSHVATRDKRPSKERKKS